jgi:DNA-binding NarL/FixJ family response regulator
LGSRIRKARTRVKVLLAEANGPAGAAIRDVIKSIVGVDLVWDARETSEALRFIGETHPDVALFSHSLMKSQLLTTIRATAAKSLHTRILVISMHNDSRFALRTIEAGASGYMLGDRAFEELGAAVNVIVSGRTYLSPGIAGMGHGEDGGNRGATDDRF